MDIRNNASPISLPKVTSAAADNTRVAVKPAPIRLANTPVTSNVDTVHISLGNKTNGQPAAVIRFAAQESADKELGAAVHVDKPRDPNQERLFGILNLTSNQRQQIRAAESKVFDRFFYGGNQAERGSMQAKLRQAAIGTYQPGYLDHGHATSINDNEKDQIMDALKEYGEELAAIGISGRSRRDLQRHLEDKFFITIFDRDKEEFEDYFKGGVSNFFSDQAGMNTPDNNMVVKNAPSDSETLINLPQNEAEKYKIRYFRPRLGVSLKGTDFQEAKIRPKVDLVRLNGPADTEVRVVADVPFTISGKYEPRAEIHARRMFNQKQGEYGSLTDNIWAETRNEYDFTEKQLRSSVGVRKQISPDSSMGLYALYSKSFDNNRAADDVALGVNYQSRFD